MVDVAEYLLIQSRMIKALDGKPISTKAERLAAYNDVGIVFDGLTAEDLDAADQEAHSISLLKRMT